MGPYEMLGNASRRWNLRVQQIINPKKKGNIMAKDPADGIARSMQKVHTFNNRPEKRAKHQEHALLTEKVSHTTAGFTHNPEELKFAPPPEMKALKEGLCESTDGMDAVLKTDSKALEDAMDDMRIEAEQLQRDFKASCVGSSEPPEEYFKYDADGNLSQESKDATEALRKEIDKFGGAISAAIDALPALDDFDPEEAKKELERATYARAGSDKIHRASEKSIWPETYPEPDMVKSPAHYTGALAEQLGIEVVDISSALELNGNRSAMLKYVLRAGLKDPDAEIQDLEKIQQYAEFEIRRLKGDPVSHTRYNKLNGKN